MTEILHRHASFCRLKQAIDQNTGDSRRDTSSIEPSLQLARSDAAHVSQDVAPKAFAETSSPSTERLYVEIEGLVEKLPSQVSSLLELVQEGRLDVHLSHRGLNPSINRLVLGMLTSSLFLGSSFFWPTTFRRYSFPKEVRWV